MVFIENKMVDFALDYIHIFTLESMERYNKEYNKIPRFKFVMEYIICKLEKQFLKENFDSLSGIDKSIVKEKVYGCYILFKSKLSFNKRISDKSEMRVSDFRGLDHVKLDKVLGVINILIEFEIFNFIQKNDVIPTFEEVVECVKVSLMEYGILWELLTKPEQSRIIREVVIQTSSFCRKEGVSDPFYLELY